MNNDTISTTEQLCQLKHQLVASIYSVFFSWNVLFCIVVIFAIIKLGRSKVEFRNSYHKLLINLLSADTLYFSAYLLGSLPNILTLTCRRTFNEIGLLILGFGNIVSSVSIATNILLIALNRCFTILNAHEGDVSNKTILALRVFAWLAGPMFALINYITGGCMSRFNDSNPSFGVRCTTMSPLMTPHAAYCYSCTYGSLLLYLICIRKLRKKANQVQTQIISSLMYKRQMQILLQAMFICLSMTFSLTTFRLLPFITNEIVFDFAHICLTLNGPYSMPIIALLFSSNLRMCLRSQCSSFKSYISWTNGPTTTGH